MSQIMISLNMIKNHEPCEDGWGRILAARGGEKADFNEMFPLVDAFESNSFEDVLWATRCLPAMDSLWRKYSVWAARQCQHAMRDARSIKALDVAWMHSEGNASDEDLTAAMDAAWAAARAAAMAAAWAADGAAAMDAAWAAARAAQKAKLEEILNAGEWVK